MRYAITCAMMLFIASGCAATYVTPGAGAKMQLFAPTAGATPMDQARNTDDGIKQILDKKPLASFPASVALVRVQAPGYRSHTACGIGSGRYSVITTRDVEADTDLQKLDKLPMLRGIAALNRLVIGDDFQSDYELREAAAKMHADMVLVYTIDTQFLDVDHVTPLSIVTLGASTTKNMRVISTASAALIDTRSGYVYGLAEGSKRHEELQNAWKTEDEIDRTRRENESQAFAQMVDNLQLTWTGIAQAYATPMRTTAGAGTRYQTMK